jgi:hypothetical protein
MEHTIKRTRESRIAITDEKAKSLLCFLQLPNDLSRLQRDPDAVGMSGELLSD